MTPAQFRSIVLPRLSPAARAIAEAQLDAPSRAIDRRPAKTAAHTDPDTKSVSVTLDGMKTVNPLNSRKHWRKVAETAKRNRDETYRRLLGEVLPELPVRVQMIRTGPMPLNAWDGLPACLKPCVDGCADAYGTQDEDRRIEWMIPKQEKGPYAVRIVIERRKANEIR